MTERRKDEMVKSVVFPILVAVITGISASYIATRVTIGIIETKINYIELDVGALKRVIEGVSHNQLELAKRGEWMKNIDSRIKNIESTQSLLIERTRDRYTREDAKRDREHLKSLINKNRSVDG